MIIHSNFSKMKSKILPTCLQGNYRDSLGEISNSYGMFGVKSVWVREQVTLYAGILTGCSQKWGIVQHYEVNCAAKKTNCVANCAAVNS